MLKPQTSDVTAQTPKLKPSTSAERKPKASAELKAKTSAEGQPKTSAELKAKTSELKPRRRSELFYLLLYLAFCLLVLLVALLFALLFSAPRGSEIDPSANASFAYFPSPRPPILRGTSCK